MRVLSILALALLQVSAIQIEAVPAELAAGKPAAKGGKAPELINGMNLPPRAKNVIKPSSIVDGTFKGDFKGPIKPSAGEKEKGPTDEYSFSPDSKGPHKVEVDRWMVHYEGPKYDKHDHDF